MERQAIRRQGQSGISSPAPQTNSLVPDGGNKTLYDLATAQLRIVTRNGKSYMEVGGAHAESPAVVDAAVVETSREEVYQRDTQVMQMQYP